MSEDAPLLDLPVPSGYRVRVRAYLFKQFRIQLIDERIPDPLTEGEGTIVRELCTYQAHTAGTVAARIAAAADPEAEAETFAKPHNCESKGGRIRLDNVPGDRE